MDIRDHFPDSVLEGETGMNDIYDRAGPEPRIEDMLADPIVRLTMKRDRLTEHEVLAAVDAARERLHSPWFVFSEADEPPPPPVWRCCAGAAELRCG